MPDCVVRSVNYNTTLSISLIQRVTLQNLLYTISTFFFTTIWICQAHCWGILLSTVSSLTISLISAIRVQHIPETVRMESRPSLRGEKAIQKSTNTLVSLWSVNVVVIMKHPPLWIGPHWILHLSCLDHLQPFVSPVKQSPYTWWNCESWWGEVRNEGEVN